MKTTNLNIISFFCFVLTLASFGQPAMTGVATTKSGTSVNSINWNHTVVSPADILIVTVTSKNAGAITVKDGVTTMTLVASATRNGMRVLMYYRVLPAWGVHNITVTNGAGGDDLFAGAEAYSNVDYTNPIGVPTTANGNGVFVLTTVASVATDLIVDALGTISSAPAINLGQTTRHSIGGSVYNASSTKPGAAGSTWMGWAFGSCDWAYIGVALHYVNTLPIELISFEGILKDKNVDLKWSTASETNNDYFAIERSADALNFEEIGIVNGAGDSQKRLDYSFVDDKPLMNASYYRLKQTDFDGSYKYSKMVAVNINEVAVLNIYPNPASNQSHITILSPENKNVTFTIISSDGKVISERIETLNKGANTVDLNVASMPEGSYIFRIYASDQILSQKQFLIR